MTTASSEYWIPIFLIAVAVIIISIKIFDARFKNNRNHDSFLLILGGIGLLFINSIGNRFIHRDYLSYLLILVGLVLFVINIPFIRRHIPSSISKKLYQDSEQPIATAKKVFISAEHSTPYYIERWLFLIFPAGLFYILIRTWIKGDSLDKTFVSAMVVLMFVFIAVMFMFFRKYRVIKVETDDSGILFIGLLKRAFVRWDEIKSIGSLTSFLGKNFAEVKTVNATLYFPMSMKEKDKIYPKLKVGLSEPKWIEENGIEKPYNLATCPLYKEICLHTDHESL